MEFELKMDVQDARKLWEMRLVPTAPVPFIQGTARVDVEFTLEKPADYDAEAGE